MPAAGATYPVQTLYSGQRRPYCALKVAAVFSIVDVAAMESIIVSSLEDIAELACDISCAELLRMRTREHGVIVLYSLYRDAILASLSIALKRTLAAASIASPCVSTMEDVQPYNLIAWSTRPIGLRPCAPKAHSKSSAPMQSPSGTAYLSPCPCKAAVGPLGLQLLTVKHAEVLRIDYSDIDSIDLTSDGCHITTHTLVSRQPYHLLLTGLSPFVSTFVYILVSMQIYGLRSTRFEPTHDSTLFENDECIAERAAILQSRCSPEHSSDKRVSISSDGSELLLAEPRPPQIFDTLMDPGALGERRRAMPPMLSSKAINSLRAIESIEETFNTTHRRAKSKIETACDTPLAPSDTSEPHTPDAESVSPSQSTAAPRLSIRSSSARSFTSLSQHQKQVSAQFYDAITDAYIPATVSSVQSGGKGPFGMTIGTLETSYNIVPDHIFQGFGFAATFLETCPEKYNEQVSQTLQAAQVAYMHKMSKNDSVKPVILLSKAHSLGVIALLLDTVDAQSLCLRFSVAFFTSVDSAAYSRTAGAPLRWDNSTRSESTQFA